MACNDTSIPLLIEILALKLLPENVRKNISEVTQRTLHNIWCRPYFFHRDIYERNFCLLVFV